MVDVAKKYCRSQPYVSKLVKQMRKNRSSMREMFEKMNGKDMKQRMVQKVIQDLLDEDVFIGSAQVVIDEVKKRLNVDVKAWYARD